MATADGLHADCQLLRVVLAVAISLLTLVPAAASARIYKWTDQTGTTVYSNRAPATERNAKNVEVLIEDENVPPPAAQPDALRTQQQLMDRIYALERQVQAQQQYLQYPAPPPPSDYGYGSSSYPSYFPYGYTYPYAVLPTRFVRPFRTSVPPRFVSARFTSFHSRGAVSRSRR